MDYHPTHDEPLFELMAQFTDAYKRQQTSNWVLIHLTLDKMAATLADDDFKCNFLNENDRIPIRILLKFVPKSPVDNKPALVQVMAWRRTGDKTLPEPMLTQLTDAYMRH